jgi:hypothetical protein
MDCGRRRFAHLPLRGVLELLATPRQAAPPAKTVQVRVNTESEPLFHVPSYLQEREEQGEYTYQTVEVKVTRKAEAALPAPAVRPLPEGVYDVIYADPPWKFRSGTTEPTRVIENQYPTLALDEIKGLRAMDISAKDCISFLWTTAPILAESLEVVTAWGFQYKSCAVWDKQHIGMGHYFRVQHELLLVATRGSPGTPQDRLLQSSVYREPRGPRGAYLRASLVLGKHEPRTRVTTDAGCNRFN